MKKRIFVYLSVLIGCLFIGLTTYYLMKSYETISITAFSGNEIYLNVNETDELSFVHENPGTNTHFSYETSTPDIISFDLESKKLKALKGGTTTLTINSTNENFGPFSFKIFVGDGKSAETPYYLKSSEDLRAMGKTRTYGKEIYDWSLDSYYQLIDDVNLEGEEWIPVGSPDNPFTGQFFGDNRTVHNLKIEQKDYESAGLFSCISDFAIIDSVKLNNVDISGTFTYAGAIAGISKGSTIRRVEVTNANITVSPNVLLVGAKVQAPLMAGGIVGCSDTTEWVDNETVTGYGYIRTTITMSSFDGNITLPEECYNLSLSDGISSMRISLGGIAGYNQGATLLNNKSTPNFFINEDLAYISGIDSISIILGGTAGTIFPKEIKNQETVLYTIYPFIKNNLTIVSCDNPTSETSGCIGRVPTNIQNENGQQWLFGNYFYSNNIEQGGSTWNNATMKVSSLDKLKQQNTYITEVDNNGDILEKWDISTNNPSSVWSINEELSYPKINFITGIEQEAMYPGEFYEINNSSDFQVYYNKLTANADTFEEKLSKKFWLTQTFNLNSDINIADLNIESLKPIGHDYSFMGTFNGNGYKIYFENETSSTLSFKNLNDEGEPVYLFGSIFAIINVGSIVQDLTVENFYLDFAKFAGAIAGVNYGNILNCYVKNIQIDNAKFAGAIAGVNYGNIQNIQDENSNEVVYSITSDESDTSLKISIKNSENDAFIGGAVGYNSGKIENIKIKGLFSIIGEESKNNVIRALGGFVGSNEGEILNCSVEQSYLLDPSTTRIFVGGFCGMNYGSISRSYTGAEDVVSSIIKTNFSKGSQTAGGFIAHLDYNGTIEKSFANVAVEGYYAAGLAADLLGKANECYVKGNVKGVYIGGFACNLAFKSEEHEEPRGGSIIDCYNTVTLTGFSKDSISAGISLIIRSPGKVENCFISNTFNGLGKKYYETYLNTRGKFLQSITNKVAPSENLGTINNIVINNQAGGTINEEVKTNDKYFEDKNQKVYYLSDEDCKLGPDGFIEKGFSVGPTACWTIEIGNYPILTNLDLDGIMQIVIVE